MGHAILTEEGYVQSAVPSAPNFLNPGHSAAESEARTRIVLIIHMGENGADHQSCKTNEQSAHRTDTELQRWASREAWQLVLWMVKNSSPDSFTSTRRRYDLFA